MPATRKTAIALACPPWEAFFCPKVQKVLKRHLEVDEPHSRLPPEARAEALAWPILAYEIVSELATSLRPLKHVQFLLAYAEEPHFVADLLVAVTDYYALPREKWSLGRIVADHANLRLNLDEIRRLRFMINRPLNKSEVRQLQRANELAEWKQVQLSIEAEHGEKFKSADSLMKFASKLARKRQGILKKWQKHFEARRKLSRNEALPLRHIWLR